MWTSGLSVKSVIDFTIADTSYVSLLNISSPSEVELLPKKLPPR